MSTRASLPDPEEAVPERARRLRTLIDTHIDAAGGMLGFDEYMQLALYAPGLGYYATGDAIFGREGDFVTAPEAGELFGGCLARQVDDLLADGRRDIVEYGAGSGRLAVTLLGALAAADSVPARYLIIEPSAGLRARQQALVATLPAALAARVEWAEAPPTDARSAVVIANEVLDALPVKRFVIEQGAPRELVVGRDGERLVWRTRAWTGPAFPPGTFDGLPDGYVSEWCGGLAAWVNALARLLADGVALLIDYGYPRHEYLHENRSRGTLQCHYQHRVHEDPFLLPGLQDITASVDFTLLAECAHAAGLDVAGYTTQAHFLLDCGVDALLSRDDLDVAARYRLAQEAKLLLLPGSMGQTIKVMAFARGDVPPLRGFRHDERHRLGGFVR